MSVVRQSEKLRDVLYDIRGPVSARAAQLEAEGHRILKLNIGNPQPFGFDAPAEILQDVIAGLAGSAGYSDSKGILPARRAVVHHYQLIEGFPHLDIDHVWIGNGVSELIQIALQALLDNGDEVLVPMPDYPLWTAVTNLAGGRPVHYRCDEANDWNPDLEDLESKITDRTKAIVVINPNNPTGAVYSKETLEKIVELARRHSLILMADEIYDKILYGEAKHHALAALAPDVLTLTFNGLSKAYRVCGYRAGWLAVTGPLERAGDYLEGITLLASMRLCPNVPAQNAIQVALGGYQSVRELILPGGRLLEQRDTAVSELRKIPGVSVVEPQGALYAFPRLDPEVYPIKDDQQFALDLLESERILITQGTGFNWPDPDHLRIVTLPWSRDLAEAISRMGHFLSTYEQQV
ncbi:MAG: pyridoxal phosphate-dependent aminotransferase [Aeromicrobium sp.]|uniref:pyridoxal phosphate-dependent aminotransferase n=1 Tax=Aeromicrobium sp. TaxID=1871063 RepID=UPI0039E69F65